MTPSRLIGKVAAPRFAFLRRSDDLRLERLDDGGGGPMAPEIEVSSNQVSIADGGQVVLRRQPPGELLKSAHAVDREFRVIDALRQLGPQAGWNLLVFDNGTEASSVLELDPLTLRVVWDFPQPVRTAHTETTFFVEAIMV